MAVPLRCSAGEFFGGHNKKCYITGINIALTSVTADTATELEVMDWNYTVPYIASQLKKVFKHKASADDGDHYFDFTSDPIRCDRGITVTTNTNCRATFYIR